MKGLLTLIIEITKLLGEDQAGLGEEITVVQSAQNVAIIDFIKTIYKIVGPSAPMIGSTGRLPATSQRDKAIASQLDASNALIGKCESVCVTQGRHFGARERQSQARFQPPESYQNYHRREANVWGLGPAQKYSGN